MKKFEKTLKKHIWYYAGILAIQIIELSLVSVLAYDHRLVMLIIVCMTTLFTSYVLVHHHFEHNLSSKIVLEYVLMGCVGIAVSLIVFH